jgi:hypothetical protein
MTWMAVLKQELVLPGPPINMRDHPSPVERWLPIIENPDGFISDLKEGKYTSTKNIRGTVRFLREIKNNMNIWKEGPYEDFGDEVILSPEYSRWDDEDISKIFLEIAEKSLPILTTSEPTEAQIRIKSEYDLHKQFEIATKAIENDDIEKAKSVISNIARKRLDDNQWYKSASDEFKGNYPTVRKFMKENDFGATDKKIKANIGRLIGRLGGKKEEKVTKKKYKVGSIQNKELRLYLINIAPMHPPILLPDKFAKYSRKMGGMDERVRNIIGPKGGTAGVLRLKTIIKLIISKEQVDAEELFEEIANDIMMKDTTRDNIQNHLIYQLSNKANENRGLFEGIKEFPMKNPETDEQLKENKKIIANLQKYLRAQNQNPDSKAFKFLEEKSTELSRKGNIYKASISTKFSEFLKEDIFPEIFDEEGLDEEELQDHLTGPYDLEELGNALLWFKDEDFTEESGMVVLKGSTEKRDEIVDIYQDTLKGGGFEDYQHYKEDMEEPEAPLLELITQQTGEKKTAEGALTTIIEATNKTEKELIHYFSLGIEQAQMTMLNLFNAVVFLDKMLHNGALANELTSISDKLQENPQTDVTRELKELGRRFETTLKTIRDTLVSQTKAKISHIAKNAPSIEFKLIKAGIDTEKIFGRMVRYGILKEVSG